MYCGWLSFQHTAARRRLAKCFNVFSLVSGFNTQPPEGGWPISMQCKLLHHRFQHTAARRRLDPRILVLGLLRFVSTHSRPKAAGCPKIGFSSVKDSFNTQPPEGGWLYIISACTKSLRFQHTAARRRLVTLSPDSGLADTVSTHSRPKAAGPVEKPSIPSVSGFNTQPPEGGWAPRPPETR